MSFFGSLTGSAQRKDMRQGYADSTAIIDKGYGQARGEVNSGYNAANTALNTARGDIRTGYNRATNSLASTTGQAAGYLQPYADTGGRANALYGDALGLNGIGAQTAFGANYAASDPFREQNADFANEALMRSLNARGQSGGGYAAEAIAKANLARGSEDYGNYLNRLSGVSAQGMQAASGLSSLYAGQGQAQANLDTGYGNSLAEISGQRANYGAQRGNALAGLSTDQATTNAGNRINLANSVANGRGTLMNNLVQLGGLAVNAYGGGQRRQGVV